MPKKQLQALIIMLAIAFLAIAGFLLVMGRLSASDTSVDGSGERKADTLVAIESKTETTAPHTIKASLPASLMMMTKSNRFQRSQRPLKI